jgi:cytochrome c553
MEYLMRIQKAILGIALASAAFSLGAAPSSKVVWDAQTRAIVKSGDVQRGEALAQPCSSCHGAKGVAPSPNWPSLAGQLATYTYKQLQDYKGRLRSNGIMRAMASGLSDQDMADLSAFYAAQPLPPPTGGQALKAPQLAVRGDGKRLIPGCNLCHGSNGTGAVVDVPALTGQQAAYFVRTMQDFKKGYRSNDIYSRMRFIAQEMSDDEIMELAEYYSSISHSR